MDKYNKPSFNVEKFIPEQYLRVLGKNLPAILKAVNENLYDTEQLIQAIMDQFFVVSASGRNLIKLGESGGFVMPDNSGLDMTSYTELVPIMISDPKQIRQTAEALVEAFYDIERTRPNIRSGIPGNYSIMDGDDLIVETSQGRVSMGISASQLSDPSNVSPHELVAVINVSQELFLAEVINDRERAAEFIRFYSKVRGHGSYIKVIGGTLQNILQFPSYVGDAGNNTFFIDKDSPYSDLIKFTWDGIGTNPEIYKIAKGDFITIRGLIDSIEDFSKLNGSYEAVDVGYDYFIIRNTSFTTLTSSLSVEEGNISFTLDKKIGMFDLPEKATVSEVENSSVTITVPAVPPLVRRHLSGSMHLQGWRYKVLDFTRGTMQVAIGEGQEIADGKNTFVVENKVVSINFNKLYKSISVSDDLDQPVYSVSSNGTSFPYVAPQPVSNVISAVPNSNEYILTFPASHGLEYGYGVTLENFTGSANIMPSDLNGEHIVYEVIDSKSIKIRLTKKYDGELFGPFRVFRHTLNQADGGDFYIEFPDNQALVDSKLKVGSVFRFDVTSTIINPYYAAKLMYKNFAVSSVNNTRVNFITGFGAGPGGEIFSSISGLRSETFGSGEYYFDKNSDHNRDIVDSMFVSFIEAKDSDTIVGSFIYDPTGEKTSVTISSNLLSTEEPILEGETKRFLQVSGSDFPDSGEIVLAYGTDKFEGPIRYYAYNVSGSGSEIMVDPAYKFKHSHDEQTVIYKIHDKKPFEPDIFGSDYPTYLTGTSNGRNTMFVLIQTLLAHGFFVERDVVLPELRYEDPIVAPFE